MVRNTVAVLNVLKCRPPDNRVPTRAETANCRPWLERQIELIDPLLVVTLGLTATEWALGRGTTLSAVRGHLHLFGTRPLLPTYHPAAAIRVGRTGKPALLLDEDFRYVAKLLPELRARRAAEDDGVSPVHLDVPTAGEMKALGARLAGVLRAGDLVVLTGDLGAGKTTLTQGLGAALRRPGPGRVPDVRDLPRPRVAEPAGRRSSTWTRTGSRTPPRSPTSTWRSRSPTPSRSSSGAPGWSSRWRRTGSRS